jgi:hypothetical protein
MKRAYFVLLALLVMAIGAPVQAQSGSDDNFDYVVNANTNGITVTNYTGPAGAVIIPTNIDGYTVTGVGNGDPVIPQTTVISSVTLPVTALTIGGNAFEYCRNVTGITIPDSVTNIGEDVFENCSSLTAITVGGANQYYSSSGGVLLDKNQVTIIECPPGLAGSYTTPATVTALATTAFASCAKLTSVTLSTGVTNIGSFAFGACTSLAEITLPTTLVDVGYAAFFGSALTNVTFPAAVTNLNGGTFQSCASLRSVTFGKGMAALGQEEFAGCGALTWVFFYGNAPTVGAESFYGDPTATAYYLYNTTGWSNTFSTEPSIPTVQWNPVIQGAGVKTNQFGFNIAGPSNLVFEVEGATNLTGAWTPLQSIILTNGAGWFSDPQWTNYRNRLYRVQFSSP